jgi:hypothetical protein
MQLHWRTALTGRTATTWVTRTPAWLLTLTRLAARRAATPCVDDQGRCSARDTHGAPSTLT